MKKITKFLVTPLSILLFSVSTYAGGIEIGEYCFTGNWSLDTLNGTPVTLTPGNCNLRIDVTYHTANYSIAGTMTCNPPSPVRRTNQSQITSAIYGSGYISGNSFIATILNNYGADTVFYLNVDLSSLQAKVIHNEYSSFQDSFTNIPCS